MNEYYEARQHLNLSQYAYDIVESDKFEFLEKPSLAKIINMILSEYMDDSDAAIANATKRYREDLLNQLASIPNDKTKQDTIEALVHAYCGKLKKKANSFPKEHQFKIQLNEENYLKMQAWKDSGGYYEGSASNYLKAVIEEYTRKPFYEREAILLRGMIDSIQAAISIHQLLVVTLRSGNRFEVKPYCVCGDPGYNYHYLVGYSRKEGSDFEERPVSFRLSRIKEIKTSHARSGKIPQQQKAQIRKHLHDVGVQFLLQEQETIRIKLTSQGKRMYESQAHLRPKYTKRDSCPDGTWIFEFSCTQMQVEYYFFKFGEHARILLPEKLALRFKENYAAANESYSNNFQ